MNPSRAKAAALKSVRRPLSVAKKERLAEQNPDMLFLGDIDDPTYDDALIGTIEIPCKGFVACYDYDKCVECLVATMGNDVEDKHTAAIEWMDFNVTGASVGDNGPVFLHRDEG
ncbi:MAG: hypothetical protein ACOYB3_00640 [Azonexus sp.]